jgi:hypothetical protein
MFYLPGSQIGTVFDAAERVPEYHQGGAHLGLAHNNNTSEVRFQGKACSFIVELFETHI